MMTSKIQHLRARLAGLAEPPSPTACTAPSLIRPVDQALPASRWLLIGFELDAQEGSFVVLNERDTGTGSPRFFAGERTAAYVEADRLAKLLESSCTMRFCSVQVIPAYLGHSFQMGAAGMDVCNTRFAASISGCAI
jgi:hypothetical protein